MLAVLLFSSGRNHGHHRMDCSHCDQSTSGRTKIVYVRIEFFNVCIEMGFFYFYYLLSSVFAYFLNELECIEMRQRQKTEVRIIGTIALDCLIKHENFEILDKLKWGPPMRVQ